MSQALYVAGHLLLASALVEFLLMRTVLRLGSALPESAAITTVMDWLFLAAMVVLNLSVITGLATFGIAAVCALGVRAKRGLALAAAAVAAGALVITGLIAPRVSPGPGDAWPLALTAIISLLVMALGVAASPVRGRERLVLGSVFVAYLATYYHYVARVSPSLGLPLSGAGEAFAAAEALSVTIPFLVMGLLCPIWERRSFLIAAIVTLPPVLMYAGRPTIATALAMWNLGISSYLPLFTYVAAFGVLLYSVLVLWRKGASRLFVIGFALVALGGLKLDNSYFNLLALSGFLLMVMSPLYQGSAAASESARPLSEAATPSLGAHRPGVERGAVS